MLVAVLAYAILRMHSAVKEANYRIAIMISFLKSFAKTAQKSMNVKKKLASELQTVRNWIEELTGK
jgi:hypothetical protein